MPSDSRLSLASDAKGAAQRVKDVFLQYCRFFTETSRLRAAMPPAQRGQQVLLLLQARDDKFVSFKDGQELFEELLYLSRGDREPSHRTLSSSNSAAGPLVVHNAASEVTDAEMVEVIGGHCTGFVMCRMLVPAAVLMALDRLKRKAALVRPAGG
jgi:hypothetical protein